MKRILTVAALFAAGCAAALAFGVSTASAYSLQDLPGLGYTLNLVADLTQTPACSMYYASGNGAPSTLIGSTDPHCTSPQGLQRNIDALIAAYPPPPPPPTNTLPPATTTVVITTTTPGTPADTTTSPAAPASPITQTVTVTTTATPVEQSLQAQINALAAQLAALTDRVTRLEKASEAAWLAYQQAIEAGETASVAAEIARGTALNVIYQLGQFAP